MTSTPEPDARLLEAHDLALRALLEITGPATIGDAAGYLVESDEVISLRFANRLPGYPGWYWTVSVTVVDGAEPTVLEVELLPGDGALLAPEWVPWATRLAEYHAAQAAAADSDDETDETDDESDSDDDDIDDEDIDDDDEDDADPSALLHAGDVDGVDIDGFSDDADESEDDHEDGEGDADLDADDSDDSDADDSDEDDSDQGDADED